MTACDPHPAELAQAHRFGAGGLLLKDFSKERLVAAIERVADGGQIWSREEIRRVTGVLTSNRLAASADVPLTRREADVLRCIASGQTNRQIAGELGISCETVKEHVQHVIRKIGVSDRTQAAVWAVRNGLV
jgi:DNA-binding NarL/FixJ family response regulator